MIGRYTTKDPIGLGGGLNNFVYGLSSPIYFKDSKGLVWEPAVGAGFDIGMGLGIHGEISVTGCALTGYVGVGVGIGLGASLTAGITNGNISSVGVATNVATNVGGGMGGAASLISGSSGVSGYVGGGLGVGVGGTATIGVVGPAGNWCDWLHDPDDDKIDDPVNC